MCLYCQNLDNSVDIFFNDVSAFEQSVNKPNFDKSKKIKEYDKLESRKNDLLEKIELHKSTQRPKHELDKGGANELSLDKEIQLLNDAEMKLDKIETILDKCLTLIDRRDVDI